jgi:hypothetical protein
MVTFPEPVSSPPDRVKLLSITDSTVVLEMFRVPPEMVKGLSE